MDRTFARETSFFGTGCVAHVPFAHPTSPLLRKRVAAAAAAEGIACQQRRNLRLHGRAAILDAAPNRSHYQGLGAST